ASKKEDPFSLSKPASFAESLKARMLNNQGSSMATTGLAAAGGDENGGSLDDFDDLFGAGFEDLSDGEDGGTGEEAERELHAKVGQEVFAELSRLEARGSAASPPTLPRTKKARDSSSGSRRPSLGGREATSASGGGVGGDGGRAKGPALAAVAEGEKGGADRQKADAR
ncbi:unnamed protein product, partial [Scytosiphon promiscuus]